MHSGEQRTIPHHLPSSCQMKAASLSVNHGANQTKALQILKWSHPNRYPFPFSATSKAESCSFLECRPFPPPRHESCSDHSPMSSRTYPEKATRKQKHGKERGQALLLRTWMPRKR
ncbi:unnamed protein product [Musa banksii]